MAAKTMAEEAPGMPEKDGDNVTSADTGSKQAAGLVAVTLPVSELQCPICVELMSDPFVTACGHTFCHPCLTTALKHRKSCPQCGNYTTEAHIFPNFLLSQVLRRASAAVAADQQMQLERIKAQILDPQMSWSVQDLDVLLSFISDRRRHQQFILEETNLELLNRFLAFCRNKKAGLARFLKGQARVLEEDIRTVSSQRQALQRTLPTIPEASAPGTAPAATPPPTGSASSAQVRPPTVGGKRPHSSDDDGASGRSDAMLQWVQELVVAKKQHVASKFSNLEKWYLQMRTAQPEPVPDMGVPDVGVPDVGVPDVEAAAQEESHAAGASDAQGGAGGFGRSLDHFTEALTMVMRYSGFRQLASVDLAPNGRPGAATLSSIEFDTSCTHLATAGVGRVVKVYNYASLLKQPELQAHAPVAEMSVGATVSSLSWNCHMGGQLLSSDYSGGVVLWDVASASAVQYFQAHSMRSWSVDYSPLQPGVFASASDDGTIKVWSAEQRAPVAMMDLGVNVCCVAWHPTMEHVVAAGTAGHSIAVYDVRAMKTALHMFAGHRKAVSHLRFMSQEELVSASTDSTLRIWQLPEQAIRGQLPVGGAGGTRTSSTSTVFSGHHNEKNFVGLSVDRSFMACGSEDNFLHVYYRRTPKPMLSYSFSQVLERRNGSSSSGSGARRDAAAVRNRFVSSVCWRRGTDQIVAATTGGVMCVVELVV